MNFKKWLNAGGGTIVLPRFFFKYRFCVQSFDPDSNQIPKLGYVRYYLLFQVSFLLDPILWMNGPKRTASNHLSRINNRYIKSPYLFFNRMIPSFRAQSGIFTTSKTCFMPSFLGLQPSFKVC